MLILINYSYNQKISGRGGKISDWSTAEDVKNIRRQIIQKLSSAITGVGLTYSPAYHVIETTDNPENISVTAAEVMGSSSFISAKTKNSLISAIKEAVIGTDSLSFDEWSELTYTRYRKAPTDIVFIEKLVEDQLADYEDALKKVNDFDSSYNPLSFGTDGIPVIVDSELFYPDTGDSSAGEADLFNISFGFGATHDSGYQRLTDDDTLYRDDDFEDEEYEDDDADYDNGYDDDIDDYEEDDDDNDDHPLPRLSRDEATKRLYADSFNVDDILRAHIMAIPGFMFFRGGVSVNLIDDSDAGTVQRSDVIVYPKGITKEDAYELIMAAYRLAATDTVIDGNILIEGATIRKSSVRVDSVQKFLKDAGALERALIQHPRSFTDDLIPDKDTSKPIVMAIRFDTEIEGFSTTPESWLSKKLKAASHDYGFTFIPKLMDILNDPAEYGFSPDYEDFEYDDSQVISLQTRKGSTCAIFIIGFACPGDVAYGEAEELLRNMALKAIDEVEDSEGFTFRKMEFSRRFGDFNVERLMKEDI